MINKIKSTKEQLDSSLQYKYDVIEKPGDTLLKDEDWKKVRDFFRSQLISLRNFF